MPDLLPPSDNKLFFQNIEIAMYSKTRNTMDLYNGYHVIAALYDIKLCLRQVLIMSHYLKFPVGFNNIQLSGFTSSKFSFWL